MTNTDTIASQAPEYVPTEEIVYTDTITAVASDTQSLDVQSTYELRRAPISYIDKANVISDGTETTVDVGDGIVTADTDNDGRPDAVRFLTGTSVPRPDVGTEFTVTYVAKPYILRYIEAFDNDLSAIESAIGNLKDAKSVETADNQELDFIGSWFDEIGERRGKSDREYRRFLRSLVQAFQGTGTKFDIKLAVAAAVNTDPENVVIDEDFEETAITVTIDDEDSIVSGAVNEMIEIAKGAGIELESSPIVKTPGTTLDDDITVTYQTTVIEGLGSGVLGNRELGDGVVSPPAEYDSLWGADLYGSDDFGS